MSDDDKDLCERLWNRAEYRWDGQTQIREIDTDATYAAHRIEELTAEVDRLRGLLREAEVKLTDVQGAYATKRYADNLLARIRAALAGDSHDQ